MNRLESYRDFYAKLVTGLAGIPQNSTGLINAFASIPREQFLGPGPWRMVTRTGYLMSPTNDSAFVYQDLAIALIPEKHINNGQPSLHARCLAALEIKPGEKVLHVGAGTGYYSAMLAMLAGPQGAVTAFELEKDLAHRAAANLSTYSNVKIENRSGVESPLPECDVIYVSAGATGPMDVWLDALRPGGRLLFPLTGSQGGGVMFLITKTAEDSFAAKFVSPAAFIHCCGARDEDAAKKLDETFKAMQTGATNQNGVTAVQSLRRGTPPDETCCIAGNGWWLSTQSPNAVAKD